MSNRTVTLFSSPTPVRSFDRGPEGIGEGQALAEEKGVTLIAGEFSRMEQLLAERGVTSVSGVTLDIGVSSMQLDRPERGFSFQGDGPLDMTIDRKSTRLNSSH